MGSVISLQITPMTPNTLGTQETFSSENANTILYYAVLAICCSVDYNKKTWSFQIQMHV